MRGYFHRLDKACYTYSGLATINSPFPFSLIPYIHAPPSKIPDSILRASTVGESPRNCHSANFISPRICPRSKLSAEKSKLEIPTKGLRKLVSSEAVRESGQGRKKVADALEEKEMNTSDIIPEIKKMAGVGLRRRVEKKPRMILRARCCACEGKAGVKYDGTCSYCGHTRCPTCIVQHVWYWNRRRKKHAGLS